MVALTGEAAKEAHAHGRALSTQLTSAEALIGDELQAELAALRKVCSLVPLHRVRQSARCSVTFDTSTSQDESLCMLLCCTPSACVTSILLDEPLPLASSKNVIFRHCVRCLQAAIAQAACNVGPCASTACIKPSCPCRITYLAATKVQPWTWWSMQLCIHSAH